VPSRSTCQVLFPISRFFPNSKVTAALIFWA
jgi:hypothetical protein